MVSERRNFQRVYDLRERIHPGWDDQNTPSYEDAIRAQVLKAAKALGVAKPDWLASYYYLLKKHVQKLLPDLVREGDLIPVEVAGFEKQPFYVHHDNAQTLQLALEDRLKATHTSILSMFDPLVTDRSRTRELFGFDYLIECYTPAPKRVYGYFVLPFRKGKLVGRWMLAWRKEKRLEVIHLFRSPGQTAFTAADLAQTSVNCQLAGVERGRNHPNHPSNFARSLGTSINLLLVTDIARDQLLCHIQSALAHRQCHPRIDQVW